MRRKQALFLIVLLAVVPVSLVRAGSRPGYVYDYAGLLDEFEYQALESLCKDVDDLTTNEIVVITLQDLSGFEGDIDLARYEYFNKEELDGVIGIGKTGKDNGVLIIVAFMENFWGIEVGYGLEGDLTDSEAGRIGRNALAPQFEEGEYYYGLFFAVASVAEELGYDVDGFDLGSQTEDLDFIDILFDGDWGTLLWWLFSGSGGAGSIIIVLVILAIFGVGYAVRRRSGGRSGGGGASGRW